jgi:hypothetical protein
MESYSTHDGLLSDHLHATLEAGIPRRKNVILGVSDRMMAANIRAAFPKL